MFPKRRTLACFACLALLCSDAVAQETPASAAKEAIEKLGGKVIVDSEREGSPVIGVRLSGASIGDKEMELLDAFSELEEIGLFESKVTEQGLTHLKRHQGITRLYLGGTPLNDAGMATLAAWPKLTSLSLIRQSKISPEAWSVLAQLNELETLDLRASSITDDALTHLRGMSRLKRLLLSGKQLTDVGMVNLTWLEQLESLYLTETGITGEGMGPLRTLTHLNDLHLDDTAVDDLGMAYLAEIEPLEILHLQRTHVGDEGLRYLKKLKKLRHLLVKKTRITDAGTESLSEMKSLEVLDLSANHLSDATLEHVSGLHQLLSLSLGDQWTTSWDLGDGQPLKTEVERFAHVSDAGVAHLAGLTELMNLSLTYADIGDEAIEHLPLDKLQYLRLRGTKITDKTLERLAKAPALRVIDYQDSSITAEGEAAFQKLRPDVQTEK